VFHHFLQLANCSFQETKHFLFLRFKILQNALLQFFLLLNPFFVIWTSKRNDLQMFFFVYNSISLIGSKFQFSLRNVLRVSFVYQSLLLASLVGLEEKIEKKTSKSNFVSEASHLTSFMNDQFFSPNQQTERFTDFGKPNLLMLARF